MLKACLHLLTLVLVLAAPRAFAGGPTCESLFENNETFIVRELSRAPDDSKGGMVTDQVVMNVDSITAAYQRGSYPYDTTPDGKGVWFNPIRRGVMSTDVSTLRLSSTDRVAIRQMKAKIAAGALRVTYDQAFEQVMRGCAEQVRPRRDPVTKELLPSNIGTWISEAVIRGYVDMFKAGRAHSIEIWMGEELVAGFYGTLVKGVFSGESMFHKKKDVAKLAFYMMLDHLHSLGHKWIDAQVAPPDSTSLSVKWGAYEIPRDEFMQWLKEAQERNIGWMPPLSAQAVPTAETSPVTTLSSSGSISSEIILSAPVPADASAVTAL